MTHTHTAPPDDFNTSHCSESRHLGVSIANCQQKSFQVSLGTQGFSGVSTRGPQGHSRRDHRAQTQCQDLAFPSLPASTQLLSHYACYMVSTINGCLSTTQPKWLLAVPSAFYKDVSPKEDRACLSNSQSPNLGLGLQLVPACHTALLQTNHCEYGATDWSALGHTAFWGRGQSGHMT